MNAKIQVGVRLRPYLEHEIVKGYTNTKINVDKSKGNIKINDNHSNSTRVFEFDHIFEQNSTSEEIYEECKVNEMVARVLDGFHSTIFAYGQTGSGKTFTMEGKHDEGCYISEEMKGIVALTFDDLFSMINKLKGTNNKIYNVTCSFLQIYNEKIYDLLNDCTLFSKKQDEQSQNNSNQHQFLAPESLKIRWNAREQFQVENLQVFNIKNSKEAQNYYLQGVKNRITASHKLNMTSSRSHTIFTITVHSFSEQGAHETSSKLQLVDLAGSERISQTGTEGKMAKESIDINKSLFTLHQVIRALSEINQNNKNINNFDDQIQNNQKNLQISSKQQEQQNDRLQHIPYRESKLTSLLKQSIGGNCYCLMMACIVPNDSFGDENISTLHYATRATYIRNQPIKNEDPNKKILSEVQKQNSELKQELDKANTYINFLTNTLQNSEKNNNLLKQQNSSLLKQIENYQSLKEKQEKNIDENYQQKEDSSQIEQAQSKYQKNELSQQLLKEQQLFEKKQEQFKLQQLNSKQYGQQILYKQQQNSTENQGITNQLDDSSTGTTFLFAHSYETIKQCGSFGNYMNQTNSNGFNFNRKVTSDTINESSQLKEFNNNIHKNEPNIQSKKIENKSHIHQIEYDGLNDKLIESITLVRSLLENNKELRQQTEEYKLKLITQENELIELTQENQELRDKVQSFIFDEEQKKGQLKSSKIIRRIQNQHNSSPDGLIESSVKSQNPQFQEFKENQKLEDPLNSSKTNNFVVNNGEKQGTQTKPELGKNSFRFQCKKIRKFSDQNNISTTTRINQEYSLNQIQTDRSYNKIQDLDSNILISRKNRYISNGNKDTNYHNMTKSEQIKELLKLPQNQMKNQKNKKFYEIETNNLNQFGYSSSIDYNSFNSGTLSNNSAKKHFSLTPDQKQNFNFYSTLKKKCGFEQTQQKYNNQQKKQNLSLQLENEFGQSQILNNNFSNTTYTSATKTNDNNNSQQEFVVGSYLLSSQTQQSHNDGTNTSIDINDLSQTLSTIVKTKQQGNNSDTNNTKNQIINQMDDPNLEKQSSDLTIKHSQRQNKSIKQQTEFNQCESNKLIQSGRELNNLTNKQPLKDKNEQILKISDFKQAYNKNNDDINTFQIKSMRSNSFKRQQRNQQQSTNSNDASKEGSINKRIFSESSPENSIFLNLRLKNLGQNNIQISQGGMNNNDENLNKVKNLMQIDYNKLNEYKQKAKLYIQQKQKVVNA